jgi:hypothetical protein
MVESAVRATLATLLLCAACGGPTEAESPDLGASDDLAGPGYLAHPVTLTVAGNTRPMSAFYSIFVEPLETGVPLDVELVITFIDPAFSCSGTAPAPLDSISFAFQARVPGVTSSYVVGRSGPDLSALTGGMGDAELTRVDDRTSTFDGGATVAPGGSVAGDVWWTSGDVLIEGTFTAPHCPALDFSAAP